MAAGSYTKTVPAYLECECCSTVTTIRRKTGKVKEREHVKHMYCYKCKEVTAHTEKKEDLFYPQWVKDLQRQEELEYEQELLNRQSRGEIK
jgi:hypothetical protein